MICTQRCERVLTIDEDSGPVEAPVASELESRVWIVLERFAR